MTTAYTSLLGLALPVTGELSGTWGDTVNNSITSLLDTSVAGTTNVSTDTDVTLTTTTGAANTARQAILLFSGARTALRTVTAPAQSKVYTVINATTGGYAVKLVGSGPTTGLTIPNGASAVVAWNGSDFVEVGSGSIGNLVVNGTLTVTGATTLQSTLAVTGNITNTAGTANGVAYLNGSKVVTSGSALTFDGTNLGVGTTSPAAKLGVAGNIFISGASSYIAFDATQSGSTPAFIQYASNSLVFGAGSSEQMRLTSTGLGIGTSSPSAKLDVVGAIKATIASTASNNIRVGNSGSNFYFATENSAGGSFCLGSLAYSGLLVSDNAIQLSTTNGGSVQATLNTSGNLGLGVTPSVWRSVDRVMQAGSGVSQFGHFVSGGVGAVYGGGFYRDDSGFKYTLTATPAGRFDFNYTASGGFTWNIAPSGTAGNAITFTQAMTLDASGNLLVGTTSPTYSASGRGLVEVNGSSTSLLALKTGGSAAGYVYHDGTEMSVVNTKAGSLQLTTNGSERARIDSSGNFGIGTSTPAFKLSVYEASTSAYSTVATGTAGAYAIFLARNPNNDLYLWNRGDNNTSVLLSTAWDMQIQTGAAKYISFATNNTERARIDSSGNFGINTSSPGQPLDVNGNIRSRDGGITLSVGTAQQGVFCTYNRIFGSGTDYTPTIFAETGLGITFAVNGSATKAMTLNSSGNLGIGTSSPASKLEINGNGELLRFDGSSGQDRSVYFRNVGSGKTAKILTDGILALETNSTTSITFATNSAERARIDSSGNLLVGTTSVISAGKYSSSFAGATENGIILQTTLASTGSSYIGFVNSSGSTIGTVTQNGASTVAYNTSSDYRLKNITGALTGYKERLMSLQPKQGTWIADGSEFRGFLAHEFAEPYRASVTGEKDAVDEAGNPIYQGMQASSSEVMADLVAMVNELITENASLKARLDAANL